MLKLSQDNKIKEMTNLLTNKVSDTQLDGELNAFKHKIMKEMEAQIEGDQMKRMAAIEDYNNQLKQLQKSIDLENKLTKQKVN